MVDPSSPNERHPSAEPFAARAWRAIVNHPHLFVLISFSLAFLLLLLMLWRGLLLAHDREIESLRQMQAVREESVSALLHLEAERVLSLRNYAEHLLQMRSPSAVQREPIPRARPGRRENEETIWSVPSHDAASIYGVAPVELNGLHGFSRHTPELSSELVVAEALGHLLGAAPPSPEIRRRLSYVSTNGLLVSYPAVPEQEAVAVLRRHAAAPWFQELMPASDPDRHVRYTIAAATEESDDVSMFLSAPVYLGKAFRAAIILEMPRRTLDDHLSNAPFPDVSSYLVDRSGRLIGASARNVRHGETLQGTLAGHWTSQTLASIFGATPGTLSDHDGHRLIYRRVGNGALAMVDEIPDRNLMLAGVGRLAGVIGSGAAALVVLLWATLAVVRTLFRHYQARGEALRTLAETDALTGLANRRSFAERFALESHRADGQPMSVVMLDIDHFKAINDKWGHASGDIVLRALSVALRANVRQDDLPARLGGEEFAILLPRTRASQATGVAEQLRQVLQALHCAPAPDADSQETIRFTASFGVAELATSGKASLDALLMQADKRLYAAKTGGRNRVVGN